MFQNLKEEIQKPPLVKEKKNEYANEVELTMEKMKSEEQHQHIKFEKNLVGIDKFNLPKDLVILGKEEDKQFVSIENLLMPLVEHGLIQKMGKRPY